MTETTSAIVQFKRMTRDEWSRSDYVPRISELVFETDTGFAKFGDGVHRFSDLRYLTGPQGPQGIQGVQGVQGPPGRDGVVTFESLSQEQKNSIKGDRGPRGEDGERGQNSYIHTRYSDNSNGENMDNDSTRQYIGIYTGYQEVSPEDPSEYSWTKIRGNDGKDSLPINENLIPDSNIANGYNKVTWEDKMSNSGLNANTEHAVTHFGRGLHIWGTPNAEYKGLSTAPFPLVAKQGDKVTLSMDLGKDAMREDSTLRLGFHYINDTNQTMAQEWQDLDLSTQNFEVKQYKRISRTFTVGADISKCRVMIYAQPDKIINFYIDNLKLERGTVATTWCPAYSDLRTGETIVNQKTGQIMKYWFGSKQDFDAIRNKDANTIYDYYE